MVLLHLCVNKILSVIMEDHSQKREERIITGMFKNRASAERAYHDMYDRGYRDEDINIMMSDETRKKYFSNETKTEIEETTFGNKALEGAGAGSAIGGALGAAAGIIAAISTSIALPGLGIVIAGPISSALTGAGAGGITGGIIGALVGAGIPEDRVHRYEKGIREGNIVMGVKPRSDEDASIIENDWRTNEARNIEK